MLVVGGCKKPTDTLQNQAGAMTGMASGCNVLLITMDTTRADHLGCYGGATIVTPVLDLLAESGVRFEQAFTQVPITLPAHTSLLTGVYPPEHGLRVNGRHALGAELPTLADFFQAHGYRTGAFLGTAILDAHYGLSRGFETYDDEMPKDGNGRKLAQRPANQVCRQALDWLTQVKDQRFMAWIHFYDPHTPYQAPPDFSQRIGDPYDAEIAFMDANIHQLLEWLKANDLTSRTLIVAVADHGESLGEHGYEWHQLLVYDAMMRVPLIFSLPGRLPEGKTHRGLVELVDVLPTVLNLMGWDIPEQVSGVAVAPGLEADGPAGRICYGESDYPFDSFGWGKLRCLFDQRWKYIRAPVVELYDRQADPRELHNLAEQHPEIVERMERELAAREADMASYRVGEIIVDAETRRALESLGYVGGAAPSGEDSSDLKNPRDMVQVEVNYQTAQDLWGTGKVAAAVSLLESTLAQSPESFVIVELLGKAYAMAGRLEDSHRQLGRAVAMCPECANTYISPARILTGLGKFEEAFEVCQQALRIDSKLSQGHRALGEISARLGRVSEAIRFYQETLVLDPDDVQAHTDLALLLQQQNRPVEAVQILRQGLRIAPDHLDMANNLAWLLATSPPGRFTRWSRGAPAGTASLCRRWRAECQLPRHASGRLGGSWAF